MEIIGALLLITLARFVYIYYFKFQKLQEQDDNTGVD